MKSNLIHYVRKEGLMTIAGDYKEEDFIKKFPEEAKRRGLIKSKSKK